MNHQLKLAAVLIFLGDFKHARRFASRILRAQLHTKNRTHLRELTHLAFNTALIVSYGRPFFKNQGFGSGASSLQTYVETVLTNPEDLALHNRVLLLRSKAYAHSDASSHLFHGIDYYDGTGVKFMKNAFVLLDKPETRRLRVMTERWIAFLEVQRLELKAAAR